jgi:hypothetical protein
MDPLGHSKAHAMLEPRGHLTTSLCQASLDILGVYNLGLLSDLALVLIRTLLRSTLGLRARGSPYIDSDLAPRLVFSVLVISFVYGWIDTALRPLARL